jgi:hypothetical protein
MLFFGSSWPQNEILQQIKKTIIVCANSFKASRAGDLSTNGEKFSWVDIGCKIGVKTLG